MDCDQQTFKNEVENIIVHSKGSYCLVKLHINYKHMCVSNVQNVLLNAVSNKKLEDIWLDDF